MQQAEYLDHSLAYEKKDREMSGSQLRSPCDSTADRRVREAVIPIRSLEAGRSRTPPASSKPWHALFVLIALLHLVTEEQLVEDHEVEDASWMTALFFVGFIALIVLNEVLG